MRMSDELQRKLEHALLGGPRRYTRLEVAAKSGVSPERARQLWRALGFASVGDDEVVFTDADVEAVRIADRLVGEGLLDRDLETSVARAVGLHMSRLAEWQSQLLRSLIADNPHLAERPEQLAELVERLLPQLGRLHDFAWRRHLVAYSGRALAASHEQLESRHQVVGFVDMVGYTRMVRRFDEAELSAVLERFESLATEVVVEHHGRVVKLIGDEVLFVCSQPVEAAEIALTLTEQAGADERLPEVRAGLASGRVLSRFGDVYGSVVNLASRLTELARPGTVLVNATLADALAEEPGSCVRQLRTMQVSGFRRVRPAVLRRARRRPNSESITGPSDARGERSLSGP
jgi:adenylate cyclase